MWTGCSKNTEMWKENRTRKGRNKKFRSDGKVIHIDSGKVEKIENVFSQIVEKTEKSCYNIKYESKRSRI